MNHVDQHRFDFCFCFGFGFDFDFRLLTIPP